jgi:hypothetical protein
MEKIIVEGDTLFKECVTSLGDNSLILSKKESAHIFDLFEKEVPIYRGDSRIDWEKIEIKASLHMPNQLIPTLNQLYSYSIDDTVYVLWNNASLPVIQSNIKAILAHIDNVTCVGFETWLYNPWQQYIVEFYYLGDITVGILPIQKQLHS